MIRGYESLKSNFQPLHQEVHAKNIQNQLVPEDPKIVAEETFQKNGEFAE